MEKVPVERKTSYLINLVSDFAFGKEIRIFGIKDWLSEKIRFHLEESAEFYKKQVKTLYKAEYMAGFMNFVLKGITYGYLIFQVAYRSLGIGNFTMYTTAFMNFSAAMNDVMKSILDIRQFGGYYEALNVDRQRGRKVNLDFVDERLGEGEEIGCGIGRAFHRADDAVGVEEDDRIGFDTVILHVDRHGRLACHHDDGRKTVDRSRVLGRRIVLRRKRRDYQVVGEVEHIVHLLFDAGDRNLTQALPSVLLYRPCRFDIIRHIVVVFRTNVTFFIRKCNILHEKQRKRNIRNRIPHRLYFPSSRGHITRRPPAIHSICSGNSAPFWPSTSVGSLSVETISRARARKWRTILGFPPNR